MFLLVDTCFWSHCKDLQEAEIWDVRKVLPRFRWGYTDAIFEELIHFDLDTYIPMDQGFVIKTTQAEFEQLRRADALIESLDIADQSLLVVASREDGIVLTDDGGLVLECFALNINAFRLPSFILLLIRQGLERKTIGARCLRYWEKQGSYRKQDIKGWKKELQLI